MPSVYDCVQHKLSRIQFRYLECRRQRSVELTTPGCTQETQGDTGRERNYLGDPKKSPKGDPGGPFLSEKGDH